MPPYAHHFYPYLNHPELAPYDPDMFTLPPRLNLIPPNPRNPFNTAHYRTQRLALDEQDAPYRAYQLACYAAPPPRLQVAQPAVATVEQQPEWEDGTSPLQTVVLLLGMLLRLPFSSWALVSRAVDELGDSVGAAVDMLRLWYGVYVYGSWLACRPLRMLLLGLAAKAGCVGVLLHLFRPWVVEVDDGPRYVLVHECRIWSGPFDL